MPLPIIRAANITQIKCLGLDDTATNRKYGRSRPVFKVTFEGEEEPIVVKAETKNRGSQEKPRSAVFASLIMEAVDPKIKFELLTRDEIMEITRVRAECFLPEGRDNVAMNYLHALAEEPSFFLTKLAFIPQLRSLESKLTKVDAKSVQRAEKLVARMSTTPALVQLGKIIAADLFNGNNDRFDTQGNLINLGNVMFEKMGDKSYVPVGLDHLDPHSSVTNLTQSIDLSEWGGHNLKKAGELAVRVIQSINAKIRQLVPDPSAPQLDQSKCGGILKAGIEEGANLIRQRLMQIYTAGGMVPGGAAQRMRALGWIK